VSTASSPAAARRAGWFANRPLAVKFAILVGVVVLAFGGVLLSVLTGNASVREANTELGHVIKAEELVLQLDTRASELKVDGFKALVREDPAAQLEELADDIATPAAMLEELATIHLEGASAEAVDAVAESYGAYTDAITTFLNGAVADQAGMRPRWEEIQAANDLTDGAVGAAKDALAAESAAAEAALDEAIDTAQLTTVVVLLAGLVLVIGLSVVTVRSITRPVRAVKASLDALATGDLTVETGIRAEDEVGQMAAALATAQASLREVLSSVVASADAVAASSEELSASSAQISASAEETSAQSGVVAGAADEVSRNVQTVAAGAEQMGASIREIERGRGE